MNTKKSLLSAKARVIVAALVIVGIAVSVVAIWHHHNVKKANAGAAAITSGPRISSIPGAGNPSNQYIATQNLQNQLEAQKARKRGSSSVPTITRPSFIGNPNAFGNLDNKSTKIGLTSKNECPIKKVIVMFKPNPSSCTVKNLKLARQTGVTAEELICQACACPSLKLAGYTVGDLKNIGFTAKQLRKCGFTLGQLVEAGFSAAQLKAAGYTAKQLANDGFTAGQLASAGFTTKQIQHAGYTPEQLAAAGITSENCNLNKLKAERKEGVSAATLKTEGCGVAALKAAGYTAAQLKKAGYSATALKNAGFSDAALKAAGYTPAEIRKADEASKNCNVATFRKERLAGVSAQKLKHEACGLAALKAAGFTATALKDAGYTAAQLKKAGYSAAQLRHAGFTAAQLKKAGYSAAALRKAGYSAAQLKHAGFTAGQLKAAGYDAKQLKAAGFSAKQLRNAGFSAAALKNAGYTAKQLRAAGFSKGDLLRAGFSPEKAGYISAKAAKQAKHSQADAASNAADIAAQMNSANDGAIPSADTPEARLAQLIRQQQRQMNVQQRQNATQRLQGAMTMQAQRMVGEWGNTSGQIFQKANPPKVVASGSASGKNSLGTLTGKVLKAGTIMYAVLETSINSDEKSPVMATIVAGPLKGSKLLGRFVRVNKRLLISFNLLNDPHYAKSIAIRAVAIDPNTARTAISGQVNNHYLLRYGTLFASAFLSGMSKAIIHSGSTSNCFLGSCVTTYGKLNTNKQVMVALGNVGKQYAYRMYKNFDTPPTVTIRGGTGIGILFMKDLQMPSGSMPVKKEVVHATGLVG